MAKGGDYSELHSEAAEIVEDGGATFPAGKLILRTQRE